MQKEEEKRYGRYLLIRGFEQNKLRKAGYLSLPAELLVRVTVELCTDEHTHTPHRHTQTPTHIHKMGGTAFVLGLLVRLHKAV